MTATLYGISNCSTVKRAKDWLASNNIDYQFHDYRQHGLDDELLDMLMAKFGWQQLLNKRSSSWRAINAQQQAAINEQSARQFMQATPTLIKRPILLSGDLALIGYTPQDYQSQLR